MGKGTHKHYYRSIDRLTVKMLLIYFSYSVSFIFYGQEYLLRILLLILRNHTRIFRTFTLY